MISESIINSKKYKIPEVNDDSLSINKFLDNHKDSPVVVVQGLGFVGAVMSLICSNALNEEYAVIGVDLKNKENYWKIESINDGVFPVVSSDKKIAKFFKESQRKRNLYATWDPYAYSKADVIIVDINLDVDKESSKMKDLISYDVNLNPFRKAIKIIGENCKEDALILVETTVPPGTCDQIVKPIIKEELIKRGLSSDKIKIGHSYERVMPGPNYIDSIQNFYRVFSGIDKKSEIATENFLKSIISTKTFPLTRLNGTNATEMAKVLENSFRAMNIAFMVEWSRFAELAEVDLYEIVKAIRMRPTHKNIMLPGIGVGGYCLTKDPLLASWSKQNMFNSEVGLGQSEMGVKINDKMPQNAFNFLKKNISFDLKDKKILLLGVSYLSNVGDTRYTPVELFYNCLISENAKIQLHDPFVSYWEEKEMKVNNSLNDVLAFSYDIIVFSTGHNEYADNKILIDRLIDMDNLIIYDTIGILNTKEITLLKKKHVVYVLGRGDIK